MILDRFKLHTAIVQITYPDAYRIWDRAGSIACKMAEIWPNLELDASKPNEQTFVGPFGSVQIGLRVSTVSLNRPKMDEATVARVARTIDVWRHEMGIVKFNRISCRCRYLFEFPSKVDANRKMLDLNLVAWPKIKVFDQPVDGSGNSAEVALRFEDESSFAVLRVGSEHMNIELKANADLENEYVKRERHSLFIDFDRGHLAFGDAENLRFEHWFKGYQHLLRRDVEKVIRL